MFTLMYFITASIYNLMYPLIIRPEKLLSWNLANSMEHAALQFSDM